MLPTVPVNEEEADLKCGVVGADGGMTCLPSLLRKRQENN